MLFVSDDCGDDRKKRFVEVMCSNKRLAHFTILYIYPMPLRWETDCVQGAVVLHVQHLITIMVVFR